MIEQNATGHFSTTRNTGPDLWHLDHIDERDFETPGTYSYESDGSGVDIYIVDSGVMASHNEFATNDNVTTGGNFVVHLGDDAPADDPCEDLQSPGNEWTSSYYASHGTGVAASAAGWDLGVAKGARIIPVKVAPCRAFNRFDPFDYGEYGEPDLIATAWGLDWILEQVQISGRKSVVNMSFFFDEGVNAENCYDSSGNRVSCDGSCGVDREGNPVDCVGALEHNIDQLLLNGVPVITSANNQGINPCIVGSGSQSPARMGYGGSVGNWNHNARVITVGGTDTNRGLWGHSNSGPCVSIYAPAALVRVAYTTSNSAERPDFTKGTSYSAPIVAGAAARILQGSTHPSIASGGIQRTLQVWYELRDAATQAEIVATQPGDERVIYVSPFQ